MSPNIIKNRKINKIICILITLLLITTILPSVIGIQQKNKSENKIFSKNIKSRFGELLQKIADRFPKIAKLHFFTKLMDRYTDTESDDTNTDDEPINDDIDTKTKSIDPDKAEPPEEENIMPNAGMIFFTGNSTMELNFTMDLNGTIVKILGYVYLGLEEATFNIMWNLSQGYFELSATQISENKNPYFELQDLLIEIKKTDDSSEQKISFLVEYMKIDASGSLLLQKNFSEGEVKFDGLFSLDNLCIYTDGINNENFTLDSGSFSFSAGMYGNINASWNDSGFVIDGIVDGYVEGSTSSSLSISDFYLKLEEIPGIGNIGTFIVEFDSFVISDARVNLDFKTDLNNNHYISVSVGAEAYLHNLNITSDIVNLSLSYLDLDADLTIKTDLSNIYISAEGDICLRYLSINEMVSLTQFSASGGISLSTSGSSTLIAGSGSILISNLYVPNTIDLNHLSANGVLWVSMSNSIDLSLSGWMIIDSLSMTGLSLGYLYSNGDLTVSAGSNIHLNAEGDAEIRSLSLGVQSIGLLSGSGGVNLDVISDSITADAGGFLTIEYLHAEVFSFVVDLEYLNLDGDISADIDLSKGLSLQAINSIGIDAEFTIKNLDVTTDSEDISLSGGFSFTGGLYLVYDGSNFEVDGEDIAITDLYLSVGSEITLSMGSFSLSGQGSGSIIWGEEKNNVTFDSGSLSLSISDLNLEVLLNAGFLNIEGTMTLSGAVTVDLDSETSNVNIGVIGSVHIPYLYVGLGSSIAEVIITNLQATDINIDVFVTKDSYQIIADTNHASWDLIYVSVAIDAGFLVTADIWIYEISGDVTLSIPEENLDINGLIKKGLIKIDSNNGCTASVAIKASLMGINIDINLDQMTIPSDFSGLINLFADIDPIWSVPGVGIPVPDYLKLIIDTGGKTISGSVYVNIKNIIAGKDLKITVSELSAINYNFELDAENWATYAEWLKLLKREEDGYLFGNIVILADHIQVFPIDLFNEINVYAKPQQNTEWEQGELIIDESPATVDFYAEINAADIEFEGSNPPASDELLFHFIYGDNNFTTAEVESSTNGIYTSQKVTHTYAYDGDYIISVTIEDQQGTVYGSGIINVRINDVSLNVSLSAYSSLTDKWKEDLCFAYIDPDTNQVEVDFKTEVTTDHTENYQYKYEYNFGFEETTGRTSEISQIYKTGGYRSIQVKVTEIETGTTGQATLNLRVLREWLIVNLDASNTKPDIGEEVTFTADVRYGISNNEESNTEENTYSYSNYESFDPPSDEQRFSYLFIFGDGTETTYPTEGLTDSKAVTVKHSYSEPGLITVTVIVTDYYGTTVADDVTLSIDLMDVRLRAKPIITGVGKPVILKASVVSSSSNSEQESSSQNTNTFSNTDFSTDDYSYVFDYGDGTQSSPISGGTSVDSTEHIYREKRRYNAHVTVVEKSTGKIGYANAMVWVLVNREGAADVDAGMAMNIDASAANTGIINMVPKNLADTDYSLDVNADGTYDIEQNGVTVQQGLETSTAVANWLTTGTNDDNDDDNDGGDNGGSSSNNFDLTISDKTVTEGNTLTINLGNCVSNTDGQSYSFDLSSSSTGELSSTPTNYNDNNYAITSFASSTAYGVWVQGPNSAEVGELCTFTVSVAGGAERPLQSISWSFGAYGDTVSRKFWTPGTYQITCTVTDANGVTASDSLDDGLTITDNSGGGSGGGGSGGGSSSGNYYNFYAEHDSDTNDEQEWVTITATRDDGQTDTDTFKITIYDDDTGTNYANYEYNTLKNEFTDSIGNNDIGVSIRFNGSGTQILIDNDEYKNNNDDFSDQISNYGTYTNFGILKNDEDTTNERTSRTSGLLTKFIEKLVKIMPWIENIPFVKKILESDEQNTDDEQENQDETNDDTNQDDTQVDDGINDITNDDSETSITDDTNQNAESEIISIIEDTSNYDQIFYIWDFGDGTIGQGLNPVHTYKITETTNIVNVVDGNSITVYEPSLYIIKGSGELLGSDETIIKIEIPSDINTDDSENTQETTSNYKLKNIEDLSTDDKILSYKTDSANLQSNANYVDANIEEIIKHTDCSTDYILITYAIVDDSNSQIIPDDDNPTNIIEDDNLIKLNHLSFDMPINDIDDSEIISDDTDPLHNIDYELCVTPDYLIWVDGSFITADKVSIGDQLYSIDGHTVVVTNIETISAISSTFYDLKIKDDLTNYFAEGILVKTPNNDNSGILTGEKIVIIEQSTDIINDEEDDSNKIQYSTDEKTRINQFNERISNFVF